MNPREIHVQQPWFDLITKGEYQGEFVGYKTIEGKPGAEGEFKTGEVIEIACNSSSALYSKSICVNPVYEIEKVVHYDTLHDYLRGIDYKKAAPHASSLDEAISKYLDVYYSPQGTDEHIQVFSDKRIGAKGGINALYLRKF